MIGHRRVELRSEHRHLLPAEAAALDRPGER